MAKFECVASGNPQPSVYWTKEGMKELMFPDNTYDRHHVTLEGVLEIKDVRKDDAGYYVCSAFSIAGSATTRAFLEVSRQDKFPFHVNSQPSPQIYTSRKIFKQLKCGKSTILVAHASH